MPRRLNCLDYLVVMSLWPRVQRACADIPLADQPVSVLRAFFEDWHSELTAS
jgi:hypothetical protein